MYNFYRTLMYTAAIVVLVLSLPFFITYGISYTLLQASQWSINKLADNPISQFLVKKVVQFTPASDEEIE